MLSVEQYNAMLPYKPVIDLFVKSGTCIGGIDGLISIYEEANNVKINTSCVNCIADMLTVCYINLKNYENGST